ncbi:Tau-tubulin kinase Asator like protein [Balamuthia mandrillaris]
MALRRISQERTKSTSMLNGSHIIKGTWKILRKIGQGAFGEIYSGRDIYTNKLVAIKVERADSEKQVLRLEVAVLKKLQNCPWVVPYITCGRHGEYNYMVMELLGDNISELRRKQPGQKFSILTTCKLGMQMLRAIEAVHDLGYLHRDIKPSNYAMGLGSGKKNMVFLIDFGLARKYVTATGEVRPPRESAGFRGTARYASINSHDSKDLGRRDDLWSLFYALLEFCTGSLPWRRIKDKDQVGEMKKALTNAELVADRPEEFMLWMEHLQGLGYSDRPDYQYLYDLLRGLYRKLHGDENTPFDWQRAPSAKPQRPRQLPMLRDLCFVQVSANVENYDAEDVAKLPPGAKKQILDFQIRVCNGRMSPVILDRLLDPELRQLDLMACEFKEADYEHIATVCTKLQKLSLEANSDAVLKHMISHNHKLEELTIQCTNKLSNRALKSIAEHCPDLQVLRLKCSERVADKTLEVILRSCTQLKELSLMGCKKIKGSAFRIYSNASSLSLSKASSKKVRPFTLQHLNLSYCELNKKGFKAISKISADLRSLHFSPLSTSFKVCSMDFIGLVQHCSNLTTLELSTYRFEMDTVLVEVSKSCPKLTCLLLDGTGMTDYGLQSVIQHCPSLETLRFCYGDGVTDSSLLAIAAHTPELKSLTLDFWNKYNQLSVSDGSIQKILARCTQLRELSLSNCIVLTGSCFPENAYFPALQVLNLAECIQINDSAIKRITDSCPNLVKIDLTNIDTLTEDSFLALAAGCPMLEELYIISCSCFTDNAIRSLLQALPRLFVHLTRYTDFDLHGTQKEVNITTADEIFSKFPNTFRERAFEKKRKRLFGMEA